MASLSQVCIALNFVHNAMHVLGGAGGRAYWVWWSGEGWVFIWWQCQLYLRKRREDTRPKRSLQKQLDSSVPLENSTDLKPCTALCTNYMRNAVFYGFIWRWQQRTLAGSYTDPVVNAALPRWHEVRENTLQVLMLLHNVNRIVVRSEMTDVANIIIIIIIIYLTANGLSPGGSVYNACT
jgi:hypothetical protein